MELNSIEAIKNAVQAGLGAAFVSVSAIEKELQINLLHRANVDGVVVKRTLSVIVNPSRYRSKAAEAFIRDVLPKFTMDGWRGKDQLLSSSVRSAIVAEIADDVI